MSINCNLELLEEAKQLGQHKTKQATINAALKEYVTKQKRLAVIKAFGSFDFDDEYDYKKERQAK
ncbi:MAG: type II toxin-antitoxin system VapB family antitoxin [Gammaproteobacteria bacterium]